MRDERELDKSGEYHEKHKSRTVLNKKNKSNRNRGKKVKGRNMSRIKLQHQTYGDMQKKEMYLGERREKI
jgi:hypothetical protein